MTKPTKMIIHIPASKPRNPYVVPALMRRAGAHGKTFKAIRQQKRQQLNAALHDLLTNEIAEFEI